MKKAGLLGLFCAALLVSVCVGAQEGPAAAAKKNTKSQIVLAVNGLNCSTTLGQGTVEVFSWSFGATNTVSTSGSGGGAGAGKPTVGELNIHKKWDDCSPQFFFETLSGKAFKTATLTQSDKNGNVLLTVQLTNAVLTNFQLSGEQTEEFPMERLSFDFEKICIKDANGGAQACYNKLTNSGQ